MHTIILAGMLLFSGIAKAPTQKVYVCDNGTTKVYHQNSGCNRLNQCSHRTVTMSVQQAHGKGLRACRDKSD